MIDCRNYSQEARRGGDYSGSHERYRKPARSTAPLQKYATTWYVQGRLEIISTPSAASGTILWGTVAVVRIESVDGLEMRRKHGRWFQPAPYTNAIHHTFSIRALPQREESSKLYPYFPALCPKHVGLAVEVLRLGALSVADAVLL